MSDIITFNYKDHWQEEEIILEKSNSDDKSWGFTITGGIDLPFINSHFTYIIVTHITENSLAHRDKRLKLYDIILRVNNFDFTNIEHQTAAKILRTSGEKVQLLIRRLSPPITEVIELEHNGKLGISISGGIGSEYFEKDHGIFITDIDKYQTNKQLDIGDRLLQISSTYNTYDLRFVTHEDARKYIQLVCADSKNIKLYVGHIRPVGRVQSERIVLHQGQYDPFGSKDEDSVPVNKNNYSTISNKSQDNETEHHYVNYETIDAVLNELDVDNRNEEMLIMSFNFDDYQRYENHGRVLRNRLLNSQNTNGSTGFLTVEQKQSKAAKSATPPTVVNLNADREGNTDVKNFQNVDQNRNYTVNATHRNGTVEHRAVQQSKPEEAAIHSANEERLRRQQSKTSQRARTHMDAAAGGGGILRWQVN